jgi:hypothetical protein
MNADVRLSHNDASVVFERFGDEVVAIHLGTGRYYSLPAIAGEAFLLIAKNPTITELADVLAVTYDAESQVIARDLGEFLTQLKDESLIVEEKYATSHSLDAATRVEPRRPYIAPAVHSHRDLENLFLVDPIHETDEAGWPHVKKAAGSGGGHLRYRFVPERCLFEQFEEATIALNLNTGAYFSFSGTAEDILLLVNDAPTQAEIVKALQTKYVADAADLSEAVTYFLERLVQTDLILAEDIDTDTDAEVRVLALARPGEGLAFLPPDIAMYRDAPAAAVESGNSGIDSSLLSRKKKFTLNREENIVALAEDGAIAVHTIRGVYFVLNRTAARVLGMLDGEPTASDIVSALEREYDVRRPELVAAVIVLLQNFIGIGVAVAEPVNEDAPVPATRQETKTVLAPFEPFSVDMRHDFRDSFCLYPGGRPTPAEPAQRGRELSVVLDEYFQQATTRSPMVETKVRVAGRSLRIQCVGGEHSQHLTMALSHLRHDFSGEGDFTIHVWDGEVAGPASNSLLAAYLQTLYRDWTVSCGTRGELRGFHSPSIPAFYMPGPDIVNLVDVPNKRAFFFKRDASPLPYWEAGSPFRAILHAWLSKENLQFVHGGAVGESDGGVLLAARGGSGKSTTTLLCLNAGMLYAGDDYCALDCNDPVYVHSLYNTAKLLPQDMDRFPHLRERIWNPQSLQEHSTDKATFFLGDLMPERMSSGFPLRALLIPKVVAQTDTYLTPCGPAGALAAIAPNTVAQLPIAMQIDMDRMAVLAAKLPAYILHLGSDLTQIPDVVRSVLR